MWISLHPPIKLCIQTSKPLALSSLRTVKLPYRTLPFKHTALNVIPYNNKVQPTTRKTAKKTRVEICITSTQLKSRKRKFLNPSPFFDFYGCAKETQDMQFRALRVGRQAQRGGQTRKRKRQSTKQRRWTACHGRARRLAKRSTRGEAGRSGAQACLCPAQTCGTWHGAPSLPLAGRYQHLAGGPAVVSARPRPPVPAGRHRLVDSVPLVSGSGGSTTASEGTMGEAPRSNRSGTRHAAGTGGHTTAPGQAPAPLGDPLGLAQADLTNHNLNGGAHAVRMPCTSPLDAGEAGGRAWLYVYRCQCFALRTGRGCPPPRHPRTTIT